jgi:hypothetical protein
VLRRTFINSVPTSIKHFVLFLSITNFWTQNDPQNLLRSVAEGKYILLYMCQIRAWHTAGMILRGNRWKTRRKTWLFAALSNTKFHRNCYGFGIEPLLGQADDQTFDKWTGLEVISLGHYTCRIFNLMSKTCLYRLIGFWSESQVKANPIVNLCRGELRPRQTRQLPRAVDFNLLEFKF